MGDKPIATFMDTYLRSMRMCYNIAHQYDQHSEVFISFSHGWNIAAGGGWYKVRDMLDFMNQFSVLGMMNRRLILWTRNM